jgi:hypothetical protein
MAAKYFLNIHTLCHGRPAIFAPTYLVPFVFLCPISHHGLHSSYNISLPTKIGPSEQKCRKTGTILDLNASHLI